MSSNKQDYDSRNLIPKRIIQTGKSIPTSLKTRAMVKNIQLLNPEFEYVYFTDPQVETFMSQEFPQYRKTFDSFRYPIQKFDFFRYLAVYKYGGFYFDLDVLLATDLSELLEYGCVFPFEGLTFSEYLRKKYSMDWEIGNYGFGATPEHPFLYALIENCVRAQKDEKWGKRPIPRLLPLSRAENYVLFTTGPGLVSRTFAENPDLAKKVKILFPDDLRDPSTWYCFGHLGVHLMDSSWRPKTSRVRNQLKMSTERWRRRYLLKQSTIMGKLGPHGFAE